MGLWLYLNLLWKMTSWLSYKALHTPKYVRSLYCWCSSSSLSIGRHHSSPISQEPPIFSEKLLQNNLFHHKETCLFSLYIDSQSRLILKALLVRWESLAYISSTFYNQPLITFERNQMSSQKSKLLLFWNVHFWA